MRYLMLSLSLLLCALNVHAQDAAGSRDLDRVERFVPSTIWRYSEDTVQAYRIILGPLEQIGRTVVPEKEARLDGHLTRLTYLVPRGYDSAEVYRHFSAQLADLPGSKLMYECFSRDCGSSNLWANEIFDIARLYGLVDTQAYSIYRQDQTYYLLYGIQRGNRTVYAHIEKLQLASGAQRWQRTLDEEGALTLELADELPEAAVQAILASMQAQNKQVLMVVHTQSQPGIEANLTASRERARQWRQRLLAAGVEPERVQAYGVGDLAPEVLADSPYTLVIMLRNKAD